jgi:Glutamate/Leucine/Phenylalanine/Valine dehydrogenase
MEQISVMERTFASRQTCSSHAVDGKCKHKLDSDSTIHLIACYSPEAVNVSNMAALIDAEGKPHFKYIVEGANLFLTQQARLHLERRRVVLFKDSSANKGKLTIIFKITPTGTIAQAV